MSSPSPNSSAVGSPQSSFSFPPSPLFSPPPNLSHSSSPPPLLNPLPSEPHTAPSPQLNASLSDPPTSPVPRLSSPPPSASNVVSPAPVASPPPISSPPPASSPPPQPSNPPPKISPPPLPPTRSPPAPPPLNPSVTASPPPPSSPVVPKSPPPSRPPSDAPPPPAAKPPEHSPSPPKPSIGASPPSPLPKGPESSPTPPSAKPPENSPSPPSPPSPSVPPRASIIPPGLSPPPIPPSPNSPRGPQPVTRTPPSIVSLPPPSPHSPSVTPPGNTGNTISGSHSPEGSHASNGGGMRTGGTVAIALVLGLLLLGIFGTVACCVWKRKKRPPQQHGGHSIPTFVTSPLESDKSLQNVQISAPNNGRGSGSTSAYSPHESGGLGNSRPWFSYEELVRITNGFSDQNLLGEGGFGSVYKGTLIDGREVAVKQLKIGGRQGEREFKSEVEIISRIHHRHLVSLVGYCISHDQRLLVYDYLPNNTLYFHLHGVDRPVIDWATRVKIAVCAARGIAYLHEDCHPRIIHRDIKSSNILLDNNFEARVSDFGLAKLAIDTNTHITTRVMGTFGYMAPEYASSGKLTEKSDVYSFGVVLLELITGRKPVDTSQPVGEESLVEWARPLLSHSIETQEFDQLADPRLEGNYIDGEMFRLIEVAAACIRHSSTKRPKMGQVVRAFDGMATSDMTNGMKLGESEILSSAQQSEEIRFFRRMAFGSQDYSSSFFNQHSSSGETNREYSHPD